MCGIFGMIQNRKDTIPSSKFMEILNYIFPELTERGASMNNIDASGYFHPEIGIVKGNYTGKELINLPEFKQIENFPTPKYFLGHVRKIVKGDSIENENNHPLWSKNYIIIHNGTVGSDLTDKELEEMELPGMVDTRHALGCLEKYGEKDWLEHLKGTGAILAINRNTHNFLIYRDTKPIFYMRYNGIWISSTIDSLKKIRKILGATKELFPAPIYEYSNGELYSLRINKNKVYYSLLKEKSLPRYSITTTYIPSYVLSNTSSPTNGTLLQSSSALLKDRFTLVHVINICKKCLSLFPASTTLEYLKNRHWCTICDAIINEDNEIGILNSKIMQNFSVLSMTETVLDQIISNYILNKEILNCVVRFEGKIAIIKIPSGIYFYAPKVLYNNGYFEVSIGNTNATRLSKITNGKFITDKTVTIVHNIPRFKVPSNFVFQEIKDAFIEFKNNFVIMNEK